MFVSASTECFPELPLRECMEKLVDLEFSAVDMTLDENSEHLRPSDVLSNLQRAIDICHDTQRLVISNFRLLSSAQGNDRYTEYEAICKLAKAVKVASITVPAVSSVPPSTKRSSTCVSWLRFPLPKGSSLACTPMSVACRKTATRFKCYATMSKASASRSTRATSSAAKTARRATTRF